MKYKDFSELKKDIQKVYSNINIDIMNNLDHLTQEFNDGTHMDIIKNIQAIVSMDNQFVLNRWDYVRRIHIVGQFKNGEVDSMLELTHVNIIAYQEMLSNYNENGLFYRVAIMTRDNGDFLSNGDEEYFAFEEESEKLIPILSDCSRRLPRLSKIKFNGIFVAYYSGLKPRWYPAESLKDWMVDIEDVSGIRSIHLYFQDKNVTKI